MKTIRENWILALIVLMVLILIISMFGSNTNEMENNPVATVDTLDHWVAPSLMVDHELQGPERDLVVYGSDLVAHTARFFGPGGSINAITNGMNCQNCHLDAGRKAWGNNYGAVASTYPKFRDRSGSVESIAKRVNDCFERSLNGQAIDTNSHEMKAIIAYIKWLGKDVPKGEKPAGSGITELAYLNRAASPENGKAVFQNKCVSCHGTNGEGQLDENGHYVYPPLWGPHSYNSGAGLFRLSRFAGYVRDNMPFNQASHHSPNLTDEEAWDVAAFVNSQPRPSRDLSHDWPDISKKPIDHPFGPYTDGFSEQQHKYGPFKPIADARKAMKKKAEDLKGKTAAR